jgi:hypothetical protein
MNRSRCTATDYVDLLVTTPSAVGGTEAARTCPRRSVLSAHDAFIRLLHRFEPDPATLRHEVNPLVDRARGVLIVDDSTLDRRYAKKNVLVTPADMQDPAVVGELAASAVQQETVETVTLAYADQGYTGEATADANQ